MKTPIMEPIRYLNEKEMLEIHQAALHILERIGMWIDSVKCLEYLKNAGCRVDMERRIVKFPQECVEAAIAKMKSNFGTPERYPKRMSVRYSQIRFDNQPFKIHEDFSVSAGGFCCFVWDTNGNRRNANIKDVRSSLKLADKLDQISYTGLPCAAQEIPVNIRPVTMVAELVKATRKFGGIETFKPQDVKYVVKIGEIIQGSKKAHLQDPILIGYAETRSPLCLDEVMANVMLEHLERGLPQSIDTMPNAGATSPVTAAGTLALGIAETLGGLVLGFAIDPDATMSIDINPGYADMRSMLFGYAGAERVPLLSARIQMISEFYGCPSGVHGGKTNACVPGIQAGVEKAISMLSVVQAGAIGFGTVGHLENAITFSPLQLVIDNEIARYVRRSIRGIEVNNETLALDLIEETGIGGNTINSLHTAEHFKDELLLSPFFDARVWGVGDSLDKERFEKLAMTKLRELLKEENAPVLSEEQELAIDEVVKEAQMDLKL